jgi:hypothetical protein
MSLFQESIIRKHLGYLDQEVVEQAYLRFKEVYSANKITNIKVAKEEQYQEGFIKDIFGAVLGYSVFPEQPFNIQTEKKNEGNSKKADGAIFQGDNVVGVIELKDNKTKNLDAVKDQAFGYKNNHKDCSYVISSNFHKLRFYLDDATDYEEFDLYNLDKETFKRFYLYLRKEGLLDKNTPKLLRQETKFHEENITKSLYKDYASFKNSFFQNVVKNNPQYDKLLLFKKSQKFLDKVLFVLFAEDKGLVSTNAIVQIVEKWNDLKNDAFDTPKPLYHLVALFFNNLFSGKKDQKGVMLIPEFGGEIFAPDEVLDTLVVDDAVLQDDLLKLSKYDFNTDVDVNILGHIFEHSLSEIEEVEAELKGEVADKTKGKRKKDGVFYTPKYITKYIVENTVGKLCAEKKTEMKLDIDIAIFELQKTDGKLNAKGIELYATLNQYKDWLLTLKILDPACGSGAFLNQAVNFLIQEHTFVDDIIAELTNTPLRLFDTNIAILENNIYGVDINEESIEIAKLSLWLRTAKQGRKLSNLSNNIKCGNSLIDDPAVAGDKAFNWQNEFPDVFANGGFDVVIGNPPYGATLNEFDIKYYRKKYSTVIGHSEIYYLFTEKAINDLVKKGNYIGYIIPNAWLSNKYARKLRQLLIEETCIEKLINFNKKIIFEEANVETSIFILKKIQPLSTDKSYVGQDLEFFYEFKQTEWKSNKDFLISFASNNKIDIILKKVNSSEFRLSDKLDISNGFKPYQVGYGINLEGLPLNANDVANKIYHSNILIERTHKKEIKGKGVKRYSFQWEESYIKWGSWLMSSKSEHYFEQPKILVRQVISDYLFAYLDYEKYYADQSLYVCTNFKGQNESLEFYTSIINSKLYGFFFRKYYSEEDDLFPKIKVNELKNLPIKDSNEDFKNYLSKLSSDINILIKDLRDHSQKFQRSLERKFAFTELSKKLQDWYLLSYAEFIKELEKKKIKLSLSEEAEWETYFTSEAKKALELKAQIAKTDKEIDQLVYALYELTEDEIKIVEGS